MAGFRMSFMDALKVAAQTREAPSEWLTPDSASKSSWPSSLDDPSFAPVGSSARKRPRPSDEHQLNALQSFSSVSQEVDRCDYSDFGSGRYQSLLPSSPHRDFNPIPVRLPSALATAYKSPFPPAAMQPSPPAELTPASSEVGESTPQPPSKRRKPFDLGWISAVASSLRGQWSNDQSAKRPFSCPGIGQLDGSHKAVKHQMEVAASNWQQQQKSLPDLAEVIRWESALISGAGSNRSTDSQQHQQRPQRQTQQQLQPQHQQQPQRQLQEQHKQAWPGQSPLVHQLSQSCKEARSSQALQQRKDQVQQTQQEKQQLQQQQKQQERQQQQHQQQQLQQHILQDCVLQHRAPKFEQARPLPALTRKPQVDPVEYSRCSVPDRASAIPSSQLESNSASVPAPDAATPAPGTNTRVPLFEAEAAVVSDEDKSCFSEFLSDIPIFSSGVATSPLEEPAPSPSSAPSAAKAKTAPALVDTEAALAACPQALSDVCGLESPAEPPPTIEPPPWGSTQGWDVPLVTPAGGGGTNYASLWAETWNEGPLQLDLSNIMTSGGNGSLW